MGAKPPVVMLTADVLRDNALTAVLEHGVLPNVGSPGMIDELHGAGYAGPIAVRVNPGFGHGHVQSCDTGGPSSKHGIWHEALGELRASAAAAKLPITTLHAHLGTGPRIAEFDENLRRFVDMMTPRLPEFPDVEAINLGGGIPHPYRPGAPSYDLAGFRKLLVEVAAALAKAAGRQIRVEIEPGRYPDRRRRAARLPRQGSQEDRVQPQGTRPPLHHGGRRLQRSRPPGDVRVVPPHLDRRQRRRPRARAVRRGRPAVRERRRLHPRRQGAARPAPASRNRSWAICWSCTTPVPTAPR